MSYQRFVLKVAPATVATPATFRPPGTPTVADVATVAGHARETAPFEWLVEGRKASAPTLPADADQSTAQTVPIQQDSSRCHVCARAFSLDDAMIAVLTGKPDQRFWLHHACHDEHIRRCIAERAQMPTCGTAGLQ